MKPKFTLLDESHVRKMWLSGEAMIKNPIKKLEEPLTERFTPSPTKIVRFVNEKGEIVKELPLNRKARRQLRKLTKY